MMETFLSEHKRLRSQPSPDPPSTLQLSVPCEAKARDRGAFFGGLWSSVSWKSLPCRLAAAGVEPAKTQGGEGGERLTTG